MLKDLTENYVMPNKGNPALIRAGVTDQKTKGPLMLALAYQYKNQPIIGTIPVQPEIVTPPLFILPPKIVCYQNDIAKVNHTNITKQWMVECCLCIPSIPISEQQINHQYPSPESMHELNQHSKALSFHLISRLPHFLQYRLPPSRPDL